ncbi:MAG: manganese efflux pump [Bacteroidales bacterium]|nr:manganese efflux pump [Bacteroidales bacterium]
MSLCADCFAVTTCSSVTLKSVTWRRVLPIALVFAVVQTMFMLLGWLFGDLFVGYIHKVAGILGFLLLLFVGGSMILEAIKGGDEVRDLNGLRNIFIGAVATSIDALAVGVSMSMASPTASEMAADHAALFVVTFLSVVAGMFGGYRVGHRYGRPAEIIGGIVLIAIGARLLFGC